MYHTELGSGNKTNTSQESLLCHRSHLVWGARFLMTVGLFLLFRSSRSHRPFEQNLSAMYTHITCQCTAVCVCMCVCVGAMSNAHVHGLLFQTTYTSVTCPPTCLTPWLKYLCGSVVNALEHLSPAGSKHRLDRRRQMNEKQSLELNPGLHADIGKSVTVWGLVVC